MALMVYTNIRMQRTHLNAGLQLPDEVLGVSFPEGIHRPAREEPPVGVVG